MLKSLGIRQFQTFFIYRKSNKNKGREIYKVVKCLEFYVNSTDEIYTPSPWGNHERIIKNENQNPFQNYLLQGEYL